MFLLIAYSFIAQLVDWCALATMLRELFPGFASLVHFGGFDPAGSLWVLLRAGQ